MILLHINHHNPYLMESAISTDYEKLALAEQLMQGHSRRRFGVVVHAQGTLDQQVHQFLNFLGAKLVHLFKMIQKVAHNLFGPRAELLANRLGVSRVFAAGNHLNGSAGLQKEQLLQAEVLVEDSSEFGGKGHKAELIEKYVRQSQEYARELLHQDIKQV